MATIQKNYLYRVYRQGTYLGVLSPVISDYEITQDINSAGAQLVVSVGVSADVSGLSVDTLQAEDGTDITDESSNSLTTERHLDYVGNGNDSILMRNGNTVKVYEYSDTSPNGKLIFSGIINRWRAYISNSNNERVELYIFSDGADLDNYIYGTNTYTLQTSQTAVGSGATGYADVRGISQGLGSPAIMAAISQSISGLSYTLSKISTQISLGAPDESITASGPATVTLKFYSGVDPRTGGTLLATSSVIVSTAYSTYTTANFILSSPVTMSGGNYYWTIETTDYINIKGAYDSSNPYSGGQALYYFPNSSGWVQSGTDDTYFQLYSSTALVTDAIFSSYDPAQMVRDALTDYASKGGLITYTNSTVVLTGLSVSYTFKSATILEIIRKALEMAPTTYYWYVDIGSDTLYFKAASTTADFTLVNGKHVENIDLTATIENVKNTLYFTGGSTGTTNLYKRYLDQTSITSYGQRLERQTDNRVTLTATADTLGNTFISNNKDEEFRTQVTLVSGTGIDLTSVFPGAMVGFAGFGPLIDNLLLQVNQIIYKPEEVTLSLGNLPPRLTLMLEQAIRDINYLETVANPNNPS